MNGVDISRRLNELGIQNAQDAVQNCSGWLSGDPNKEQLIEELRKMVVEYYYSMDTRLKDTKGQLISIDPKRENRFGTTEIIDNYMCFFPRRSLIETDTLMTYSDDTFMGINMPPDNFLANYFRFKNLINNNIAHLYPVKPGVINRALEINDDAFQEYPIGEVILGVTMEDSNMIVRRANVANIQLERNISIVDQEPGMFYLAMPWLYNADPDTFIEISHKNPSEFDFFANTIEKISMASNGSCNINDTVLLELKDALSNIEIQFDKKKAELKRKGMFSFLGIFVTLVPYALGSFFSQVNVEPVKNILGSASMLSSANVINDLMELKKYKSEDPYWIIWQWKKRTKK